jgi:uncharacterized glyoxalase superfamily protein PhnB
MKLTPVLIVKEIESSLPFWIDRLGFQKVADVPDGDKLGFAMLIREGAELMFQTVSSVQKDEPKFAPASLEPNVGLFFEVTDFADAVKRLEGYPITMPVRDTFYGMREIGVFAPSGHTVVFAART